MEIKELTTADLIKDRGCIYDVPLYQREYAWTDTEITKMMTDLWDAFCKNAERNYYFGTLVVCPEKDGKTLEFIDGQQRLTTFMILSKLLDRRLSHFSLTFSNREVANGFIHDYFNGNGDLSGKVEPESFSDAWGYLRNFRPSLEDGSLHPKTLATGLTEEKNGEVSFREFILERVVFFEVTMPPDTDAMAYFEVMNNRGEQLQYHELLKAELLGKLFAWCGEKFGDDAEEKYDDLSMRFNKFWTACSKMDGHLIDHLHACIDLQENPDKWQSVDFSKFKNETDESGVPQERQSVVRDFSVFLMHVLRIYVQTKKEAKFEISLDERRMQKSYEEVNVDPVEFLNILIRTRLAFDKYVVKAKMLEGEVEGWRLKEIVRYSQKGKSSGSYKAKNTFDNEEGSLSQIIALESALQVSNADQRHKEWLHAILSADESVRSNPRSLIALLQRFAAGKISESKKKAEEEGRAFYCQGLNTPRLILNVLDYLMWLKSRTASKEDKTVLHVPNEFVFKYLNSVEHHHPQHDDQTLETWSPEQIDDIGNLFLVYSSENSSMSNREPQEKKHRYENNHDGHLPDNPKRHWMYEHTSDDGTGWSLDNMKKLSDYVQRLLESFLEENGLDSMPSTESTQSIMSATSVAGR